MQETTFLRSREEREAQRQVRARAGPSDDALHRAELLIELDALARSTRHAVEVEKSYDSAIDIWRRLQERVTSSADTKTLPAHEMKQWNKTLLELNISIEGLRTVNSNVKSKKFAFSKKGPAVVSQAVEALPPPQTSDEDAATGAVYSDLTGATVFIPSHRAVFVRRCHGCTFLALPTAGSFFIADSTECRVYVCCHQLRMKSCQKLHVFAWCASTPVVESCTEMAFGPYSMWRGLLSSDAPICGDAQDGERRLATHESWAVSVGELQDVAHAAVSWKTIDDFHWLKQTQSPNWRLLSKEELEADTYVVDTPAPPGSVQPHAAS